MLPEKVLIPSFTDPGGWNAPQVDPCQEAALYLRIMAGSSYAESVARVVGRRFSDVIDIGAGGGTLTLHCLADRARWVAVEPNPEMGRALSRLAPVLTPRKIALTHLACTWQTIPENLRAQTVFAANVSAPHHAPADFFDALAPRATREMVWVVAAQKGPSTFCLAGALPPELHLAETTPAYLRTLQGLGAARAPDAIDFADWICRMQFPTENAAFAHFLDHLGAEPQSEHGRAIQTYLRKNLELRHEGVLVTCPKRSAVLRWAF